MRNADTSTLFCVFCADTHTDTCPKSVFDRLLRSIGGWAPSIVGRWPGEILYVLCGAYNTCISIVLIAINQSLPSLIIIFPPQTKLTLVQTRPSKQTSQIYSHSTTLPDTPLDSKMPCVTKVGPTNNDIVISTNRSKRDTEGTRLYLDLVKKKYENYIKIKDKFSTEKRQIARDIAASLLPGRFMKEIKGQQGQWFVLSEEEAEDRVMQRFCDERAAKARKAKAAKKVSPKGTKKVSPKGTKKKTPKVNKTKKSRKVVKYANASVSKAAKVATNTTPPTCTPNREPTLARRHVITPTSDYEKSFKPIELTRTPTSVAVPTIYFPTPVVDIEKDLTSSGDTLTTQSCVDDFLLELLGDLGDPTMAHQHVITPTNGTDVPFESSSPQGSVDDLTNEDLLQFLGGIFVEDW